MKHMLGETPVEFKSAGIISGGSALKTGSDTVAAFKRAVDSAMIQQGMMTVGPRLAEFILKNLNYTKQRRISSDHVRKLVLQMERGQWLQGTQLVFALLDGVLILVNGQHRLTAIAQTGVAQGFQVLIIPAKDEEDVARIYRRIDRVQQNRNDRQVLSTLDLDKKHDLMKETVKTVWEIGVYIENGFVSPLPGTSTTDGLDDERLKLAEPWFETAGLYEELIKPADKVLKRKLLAASVASVAFATLSHAPSKAEDFWNGVARGSSDRGDPRRELMMWMERNRIGNLPTRLRSIPAVRAWNAWFDGRALGEIRPRASGSVHIHGTSYFVETGNKETDE